MVRGLGVVVVALLVGVAALWMEFEPAPAVVKPRTIPAAAEQIFDAVHNLDVLSVRIPVEERAIPPLPRTPPAPLTRPRSGGAHLAEGLMEAPYAVQAATESLGALHPALAIPAVYAVRSDRLTEGCDTRAALARTLRDAEDVWVREHAEVALVHTAHCTADPVEVLVELLESTDRPVVARRVVDALPQVMADAGWPEAALARLQRVQSARPELASVLAARLAPGLAEVEDGGLLEAWVRGGRDTLDQCEGVLCDRALDTLQGLWWKALHRGATPDTPQEALYQHAVACGEAVPEGTPHMLEALWWSGSWRLQWLPKAEPEPEYAEAFGTCLTADDGPALPEDQRIVAITRFFGAR